MGNILITGGAGFIGSHLVNKLVKEGYKVTVVDNLLRGKVENLSSVFDKIDFIKCNITDYNCMEKLIKTSDIVFHLAAVSRVIPSIENPELCFEYNCKGTEIITRLCSKYNKKLIFASSREVYGSAKYLPVDENHPLNPENPYGVSKVFGEKIIEAYSKCYGLDYVIFRLANVYGPQDFDRVIPIFVEKAISGENIIVYGGNQILDFIYIDDVIDAFVKAMDVSNNHILNIGSGKGTTILDLAKLTIKILKSESNVILCEKRKGEVEKFVADIKQAKKILKWKPKITLKQGMSLLLKNYGDLKWKNQK